MICEKWNTHYINRTEYPLGLSQETLACGAFCFISLACGAFCFIKSLACGAFFSYIFPLNRDAFDFMFLILSTSLLVVKMFRTLNTEWSQRYNLCQTVLMKVSNNKPCVLRYKSHNTISSPRQFITNMYSRGNASLKPTDFDAWKPLALCWQQVFPARRNSSSTAAPADAWALIPLAE